MEVKVLHAHAAVRSEEGFWSSSPNFAIKSSQPLSLCISVMSLGQAKVHEIIKLDFAFSVKISCWNQWSKVVSFAIIIRPRSAIVGRSASVPIGNYLSVSKIASFWKKLRLTEAACGAIERKQKTGITESLAQSVINVHIKFGIIYAVRSQILHHFLLRQAEKHQTFRCGGNSVIGEVQSCSQLESWNGACWKLARNPCYRNWFPQLPWFRQSPSPLGKLIRSQKGTTSAFLLWWSVQDLKLLARCHRNSFKDLSECWHESFNRKTPEVSWAKINHSFAETFFLFLFLEC